MFSLALDTQNSNTACFIWHYPCQFHETLIARSYTVFYPADRY